MILTHSNKKEIEHPNTPSDVKREAAGMLFTIETDLTVDERSRLATIHAILTGNGRLEKYEPDTAHVFEAGKYVGYFITADQRNLGRREKLQRVSGR